MTVRIRVNMNRNGKFWRMTGRIAEKRCRKYYNITLFISLTLLPSLNVRYLRNLSNLFVKIWNEDEFLIQTWFPSTLAVCFDGKVGRESRLWPDSYFPFKTIPVFNINLANNRKILMPNLNKPWPFFNCVAYAGEFLPKFWPFNYIYLTNHKYIDALYSCHCACL